MACTPLCDFAASLIKARPKRDIKTTRIAKIEGTLRAHADRQNWQPRPATYACLIPGLAGLVTLGCVLAVAPRAILALEQTVCVPTVTFGTARSGEVTW